MSKSVYEQAIALADRLNTQVGRYQDTLSQTNGIDQALMLLVHELETAARTVSAVSSYLQEAARLGNDADDDAQAQAAEQLNQAIRMLDEAKEALLRVAAHHQTAQHSAAQLMGVLGAENAGSCGKLVAEAHKTCQAMAKQCNDGLEQLTKKLGRYHAAVELAKAFAEKIEKAQEATGIANGEADKVGGTVEKLQSAIANLALPAVSLVTDLIGRLQQAVDNLAWLPSPEVAETLAATINEATVVPQKITSAPLNRRIAKASKAVQDAVNALKAV